MTMEGFVFLFSKDVKVEKTCGRTMSEVSVALVFDAKENSIQVLRHEGLIKRGT